MKIYKYDCSDEEWKKFVKAMRSGQTFQIDEKMFFYWLEVLPPVYMHQEILIEGRKIFCSFGFAEAASTLRISGKRTTNSSAKGRTA